MDPEDLKITLTHRYYINPYPDYDPNVPESANFDVEEIKKIIISLARKSLEPAKNTNSDGGVYVGGSGITYMLIHIAKSGKVELPDKAVCIDLGQRALEAQLSFYRNIQSLDERSDLPGFLIGKAGVKAVAAVFYHLIGNLDLSKYYLNEYAAAANYCKPLKFLRTGSDELFVGRAGYLCGALWMQEHLGKAGVPQKDLREIWLAIIESGKQYAKSVYSGSPLMYQYHTTQYIGAAHGISTILQILLSFPSFCREFPAHHETIKKSVEFFLTLQTPHGNFPPDMDEVKVASSYSDELVHWCHGSPGTIYLLAKAYFHFKEQKYLEACIRCGDVIWKKGLLRKGAGICHGVSGNAYAFLLLYRLTNDRSYLYKAKKFYEFMQREIFRKTARKADCPQSLFEGTAGVVCFLTDMLDPGKAVFPFFNVYYNYVPEP